MKKYLTALVLALLLSSPAFAQETEDEAVKTNAFGYPETKPIKIINGNVPKGASSLTPKPDCDNPQLAEQAQKALIPFINAPFQTIAEKRKTSLILKNADNFTPVELKDINTENHRRVAGRLVELKINNHLSDNNIKVCQSDNPVLSAKLYLVMYDVGDKVRVDIINFSNKNVPSFVFKAD